MTMSANFHHLTKVEAHERNGHAWGNLEARNGDHISIHVPDTRLAEAFVEAFDEYENWLTSQEGPTYDEALGVKCDADARMDEARKLKGMV